MPVAVRDIMTQDITWFPPDGTIRSVLSTMEENQFDVAPVKLGGYFRKFITKESLEKSDETNTVIQVADSLVEKHFIGKDIPVLLHDPNCRDLLTIFDERDQHFAFVISDGVEGIVTFADLNKSIAGTAFYYLISRFEDQVAKAVDEAVEHETWLSYFDDEEQKDIKKRYKEGERQNADLRLVYFLSTAELKDLVIEYDVWQSIGFESEDETEDMFSDVLDLRHSVMHPRPIVGINSVGQVHRTCQSVKRLLNGNG